jgi:hypothetical protein
MRDQHTRNILFLDCQVKAEPDTAPRKSMREIAELIGALVDEKKTTYWSRDKKRKVFIRDYDFDDVNGRLWLLLYSNNADAPSASYAHLQTDVQREVAKDPGEGGPQSAHLLISTQEEKVGQCRYRALLEEAQSLPRARVERYLGFLLREARKLREDEFKRADPSGERDAKGNPKLRPYRNDVELLGHLSDGFASDISAGGLLGITLETSQDKRIGFGEGRRLIPVRKQIRMKVKGSWKEDAKEIINDAKRLGQKNNYEAARIAFKRSDGSSHTAVIDTGSGAVYNDGYIKRVRLSAKDTFLPEASTEFVQILKHRMASML